MVQSSNDTGAATTDFDDEDELLRLLFELCSPDQKLRGSSPREVLARLSPAERARLLDGLADLLAMGPQAAPNPGAPDAPDLRDEVRRRLGR